MRPQRWCGVSSPRKKEDAGGPSWGADPTPPLRPHPGSSVPRGTPPTPPEPSSPAVSRSHDDTPEQADADDGKDIVDDLGTQAGCRHCMPVGGPHTARQGLLGAACQQGFLPGDMGTLLPGTPPGHQSVPEGSPGDTRGPGGRTGAVNPLPGQVRQEVDPMESWAAGLHKVPRRGPCPSGRSPPHSPHSSAGVRGTALGSCVPVREGAAGCP